MRIQSFHSTDSSGYGGVILDFSPDAGRKVFRNASTRISSIAFNRDGDLFFVLEAGRTIYMLNRGSRLSTPAIAYTHPRPIAAIGLDPSGRMNFSVRARLSGGGTLHRLLGTGPFRAPEQVRGISRSQTGGSWTGYFCFDPLGRLIVSSERNGIGRIHRLTATGGELLHQVKSGLIQGLAYLNCDHLLYTTGSNRVRLLDLHENRLRTLYYNRSRSGMSDIAIKVDNRIPDAARLILRTRYQGSLVYRSSGGVFYVREDLSRNWDQTLLRELDTDSAPIRAMLADIGLPATTTTDDQEIWRRTRVVWKWLFDRGMRPSHPQYDAALAYRRQQDFLTLQTYGTLFADFGGFPWYSDCTCTCRSSILASLLYRVGVHPDHFALGETPLKDESTETTHHIYLILRQGCHWYSLDPTESQYPELPETPRNIHQLPQNNPDTPEYAFPYRLMAVPTSTLNHPMWVR
ncbi:MAG: hypothetical protein ACPGU7_08805 [Gammaproteobacteria bacterium]